MLFDPFQSIQCHLLASPLISPRRRIALLRGAGHMLRFLNQLQLFVGGKSRWWSTHGAPPSRGPLECGLSWAELG